MGEFQESDAYSQEFTRVRFLVIAQKIEPKIMRDASGDPFRLFQEFVSNVPDGEQDNLWDGISENWRSLENLPIAKAFLESLGQWARRWNLEADWCIDRTILAFRRYLDGRRRGLRDNLSWFYPLYTVQPDKDGTKPYLDQIDVIFEYPITAGIPAHDYGELKLPAPPGGLPPWELKMDPLRGYLARVEREARQRLEADPYLSVVPISHQLAYAELVRQTAAEYTSRVEARAHELGLKKVRMKPKLKTHLEWTVHVWVLGKNFAEVARLAGRKRSGKLSGKAVAKAVREILGLIEPDWANRLEKRFPSGRPSEV